MEKKISGTSRHEALIDGGILDTIDLSLRDEFIDESLDGLGAIAGLFIELESSPSDMEIVQKIFRPIHSLKGNSTYFGLMQVKSLAHAMENLLDLIRKGKLSPMRAIVDILLQGTDELIAMLQRVRSGGQEVTSPESLHTLIHNIHNASHNFENTKEQSILVAYDEAKRIGNEVIINALNRLLPQKGQEKQPISAPSSENISQVLREQKHLDLEAFLQIIQNWYVHHNESVDSTSYNEFKQHLELLNSTLGLNDPISRESLLEKWLLIEKQIQNANTKKTIDKTIRISESKVDGFLSYVGELLTVGEMYNHIQATLAAREDAIPLAMELRRVNESFSELSKALQDSIMGIRKIPIAPTLQKLTRIIRDVAQQTGKQIETHVEGTELAIDKSLTDILESPLVHIVRNAADHGIEISSDRLRTGKSSQGNITIQAKETSDFVRISIIDDGRGLDYEKLRQKALELKIIKESAQLTDKDVVDLLFQPGVSTAKEVTDISGRGVGMDVVKRAVEEAGGSIEVQSVKGKGSTFSLLLPKRVSTQIIQGFVIVINKTRFVIPLHQVIRSFHASEASLHSIPGKGSFVKDNNSLLPILPLSNEFGFEQDGTSISEEDQGMFVLIKFKAYSFAIHVDSIDGIQQAVLKTISGITLEQLPFSGGAIMGDGSVALILNFEGLIHSNN